MAHKACVFIQSRVKILFEIENKGGKSVTSLFSNSHISLVSILHPYFMLTEHAKLGVNEGSVFQKISHMLVASTF